MVPHWTEPQRSAPSDDSLKLAGMSHLLSAVTDLETGRF